MPLREVVPGEIRRRSLEPNHHTGCEVAWASAYLSSARPGDISVGFARRGPPRLLCYAPP